MITTITAAPEPASEPAHEETYEPLAVIGVAPAEDDAHIILCLEDGSTALPFSPDHGVYPSWHAASASMTLEDALATDDPLEAVRVETVTDDGQVIGGGWRLYLCPGEAQP